MKLNLLLLGVSLFASQAWAGSISNVSGTLDTTLVDPAPALYPHFVCASGCSSGSNTGAVSQSGAWSVGVTNFPTVQTVTGTVSILGGATAAAQPALNLDGGSLEHITNLPAVQAISGSVNVGNFPASQTVNGSVSVPGIATAANQPGLNSDGGELAHITNFPATQSISKSDGSDATLGGKSDAQCANVSGPCTAIALLKATLSASSGPIPTQSSGVSIGGVGLMAGTAKVGQVAVDQTTPGSTNAVQEVALAPVFSTAFEACHILKASSALVFSIGGVAGQAEYLMLFNSATIPSDGAVAPVWQGQTGAAGYWGVSFANPELLTTGAVLCYSSTGGFTKTAISTNNTVSGQIQ